MSSSPLEKPLLALTLAIAGKREVDASVRPDLHAALTAIFDQVAASLAACHEATQPRRPLAARFSDAGPARLTLVAGLADGADQIAADLFLAPETPQPSVGRVLGAILPCAAETFAQNSPIADRATFERQRAACAFVLELDGELPPAVARGRGGEARLRVNRARGGAFSAQSELLMRHSDVLIAVDDEGAQSQVGGTRQTIRAALEFGLPVVLIRLGEPGLVLLRTRSDLEEPVTLTGRDARAAIDALVKDLIGLSANEFNEAYVDNLLQEFYAGGEPGAGGLGLKRVLARVWGAFEGRFAEPRPAVLSPPPREPYAAYRRRASELSSHYAGLYRGSFLVGYGLAVLAVALAVVSLLVLLAVALRLLPEGSGPWILLVLTLLKLLAVVGMTVLAKHAHEQHLSHRAADYRYLAERLRAMIFLPRAGSLRTPSHMSQPYATRIATQGVIDRLFDSIVRQAEPLATMDGVEGRTVRPPAQPAMQLVAEAWIASQGDYHQNNARLLQRITHWLEVAARRLNGLIIVIVLADLGVLGLELLHLLPHALAEALQNGVEPVLIAMAAVLPAAVASMNGVRFQSEFSRLADRSEQMGFELAYLEKRARTLWSRSDRLLDVLHVAEDAARLTLDEVADWTALYGKEFLEM